MVKLNIYIKKKERGKDLDFEERKFGFITLDRSDGRVCLVFVYYGKQNWQTTRRNGTVLHAVGFIFCGPFDLF